MTASLGRAALFMKFDASKNTLYIPDLSSPAVLEGIYEGLKLTLKDKQDSKTYQFTVHLLLATDPFDESHESAESSPEDANGELDTEENDREEKTSDDDPDTSEGSHPVPFLKEITQDGILFISFSEEINVASNLTVIENGTVEVKGETKPALQIEIVPGEESDLSKLNMTYHIITQTSK